MNDKNQKSQDEGRGVDEEEVDSFERQHGAVQSPFHGTQGSDGGQGKGPTPRDE